MLEKQPTIHTKANSRSLWERNPQSTQKQTHSYAGEETHSPHKSEYSYSGHVSRK